MKVRANFGMVMNLDKCIGCHTCSVTCKNVGPTASASSTCGSTTSRPSPGSVIRRTGRTRASGTAAGWSRTASWIKAGGRVKRLMNLFMNPDLPEIDDYYEPFTYDYAHLQTSPLAEAAPTARPRSQIDRRPMEKIQWGPNWEDDLAGEFEHRAKDRNFGDMEKSVYAEFEHSFQMYLPRSATIASTRPASRPAPRARCTSARKTASCSWTRTSAGGWRMCVSSALQKGVL